MKNYRNSVTDAPSPFGNETEDATDQVYRQAFADALFKFAKGHLCGKCSTVLESEALSRYRLAMAKRRGEIDTIRTKLEKQRAIENRRRELEKQNKRNRPKGSDNE
jgi:hypothetical protein